MSTRRDVRVCGIGDSFLAGVGDPEHRGWLGRVAARVDRTGLALTVYNLGVRGNTSADVLSTWYAEASRRLPAASDNRMVVSFGVNDTMSDGEDVRLSHGKSVSNLAEIVDRARVRRWPTLVVGPPPIADDRQNCRTHELDRAFAEVCAAHGVPYIAIFERLSGDAQWLREVQAGDGAHPGANRLRVIGQHHLRPVV